MLCYFKTSSNDKGIVLKLHSDLTISLRIINEKQGNVATEIFSIRYFY